MKALVTLSTLLAIAGCGSTLAEDSPSSDAAVGRFVGRWRSTTPSLEFVRLEMSSLVAAQPTVAAHLTLSGAAFDATGEIAGDSVVAPTTMAGGGQVAGTLMIRAQHDGTLSAQLRPAGNSRPQDLTFTRE